MATNQGTPSNQKPPNNTYMRYANMGFQMLVIIGLGVGGNKLDQVTFKIPGIYNCSQPCCCSGRDLFCDSDLLKK